MSDEEDVDRIFVFANEAVPFVETPSWAALEHVESERPMVAAGPHHMVEHATSDALALKGRIDVEVLDPLGVGFGSDRDQPDGSARRRIQAEGAGRSNRWKGRSRKPVTSRRIDAVETAHATLRVPEIGNNTAFVRRVV